MSIKQLEVWADSFKEGEWFLETLAKEFPGEVQRSYRYNFQPTYSFSSKGSLQFIASVYGDYRGWEPLPIKIQQIIEYGKPDILLYDRNIDKVFLGIEETAAVPTGNQSLQRLERVLFSAQRRIPFVYLVSEYGLHKDGGKRRSSIWPSYLALKLSSQYQVPSLTLFYGDLEHPEDYAVGNGVQDLARISNLYILDWLGHDVTVAKKNLFQRVFAEMGSFVVDHAPEISSHVPGVSLLTSSEFLQLIAERASKYDTGTN